jgi:hypothetical protein
MDLPAPAADELGGAAGTHRDALTGKHHRTSMRPASYFGKRQTGKCHSETGPRNGAVLRPCAVSVLPPDPQTPG